jgi:osmoprotectant transport system permease protein
MTELISWFTDPAHWTGSNGIPVRVGEQLAITLVSVAIAALIALPLGISSGHINRFGGTVMNIANLGRAIPTFALLLLFASISAIGVGFTAAVLALILFAIPPMVTNAYTGIRSVNESVRTAGRGMGMNSGQLLRIVELPLATGLIAAGIRTAVVQTTATSTLAALVGGGGLGRYILDGFGLQNTTLVFAGIILVAALTGIMELVMAGVQRIVQPQGVSRTVTVT